MTELPIACTLTQQDLAKVKEEYRASQHLYQAQAHIEGSAAVIDLVGDKAPLGSFLRKMVAREENCCAFLTFDLSETAKGFRLRMGSAVLEPVALSIFVKVLFPSAVMEIHTRTS